MAGVRITQGALATHADGNRITPRGARKICDLHPVVEFVIVLPEIIGQARGINAGSNKCIFPHGKRNGFPTGGSFKIGHLGPGIAYRVKFPEVFKIIHTAGAQSAKAISANRKGNG